MPRKATNELLQKAKKSKSDEFYTQLCDIERELQYYQGQFENKTVYCNCDNPRLSNFVKYFIDNFHRLHLKKLIASCYVESENNLFQECSVRRGLYCEYAGDEVKFKEMKGNGDFRSDECIELLKESDVVVTNPPFSCFRQFLSQIIRYEKKFLIIGNINAITYKEVFELIQQNKIWLGVNLGRGISGFIVPDNYGLYGTEVSINKEGKTIIATNGCMWITNLDQTYRHKDIELTREYKGNEKKYRHFDNCDGINVDRTQDIPRDYSGLIGVPITFLHKYNPEQFEIVRFRKGDDGKDLKIDGKCPYFRILVRNRNAL